MSIPPSNQPVSNLVETTSTSVSWYDSEPRNRLNHDVQSFFKSYCGLSGDALMRHLLDMHSRAWETRPYPCIGQWGFLQPMIEKSPVYQSVLARVKNGDTLLDLGCCLGQDLRRLAADGAPTKNMYGSDIEPGFWELGYDLFGDRGKMEAQFIGGDILDPASPLSQLDGRCDLVYLGSLLHLWDWERQKDAMRTVIKLTKPGSLVVGIQLGRVKGTEVSTGWKTGGKTYFHHDAMTIEKLWYEANANTGIGWEFSARIKDISFLVPEERDSSWLLPESRSLLFEAKRQ